jgi:FkbM family methyltransferase
LSALLTAEDKIYKDYFDMDIFKCGPGEVLVDMGSFIGDTVKDYILSYGKKYKRIYCYEITPSTFEELKHNLGYLPDVVFRHKGVSDKRGIMYIADDRKSSSNALSEKGGIAVETVAIDEDITEPVTFIKMDIEGAEQKALLGCASHIKNDRPKLAISVYHNNEDIWNIPRMIEEICPGYRFYLRYHGGNLLPTELTLLANNTL